MTEVTIYLSTDEGRNWARKNRDLVVSMGEEVTRDNVVDLFMNGVYARTATIKVEGGNVQKALDEAWAATQNDSPAVIATGKPWAPYSRSTMVGDIFELPQGDRWIVRSHGFEVI